MLLLPLHLKRKAQAAAAPTRAPAWQGQQSSNRPPPDQQLTCAAEPSGCSYSTKAQKRARMTAHSAPTVGVNVLCVSAGSADVGGRVLAAGLSSHPDRVSSAAAVSPARAAAARRCRLLGFLKQHQAVARPPDNTLAALARAAQ